MYLSLFTRISLVYIFIFAVTGAFITFFPVFLETRGFSSAQISTTMTMVAISKIFIMPFVAIYMTDNNKIRYYLLYSALVVGAALASLFFVYDILYMMLLSIIIGAIFSICIPFGESYSITASSQNPKLNYGQMRLFGTLSFLASGILLGEIILFFNSQNVILPYLFIAVLVLAAGSIILPKLREEKTSIDKRKSFTEIKSLFYNKTFMSMIVGVSIAHAGHSILMSFGSIHWLKQGFTSSHVGWFWAVGGLAEITLFFYAHIIHRYFSIKTLIILSLIAGLIRWTGMSFDPPLWGVFLLQTLHAFTFGAGHLGVMRYIGEFLPHHLHNSANLIYGAFMWGIAYAPALIIAGILYEQYQGVSYLFMLGNTVLGGAIILFLYKPQKVMP